MFLDDLEKEFNKNDNIEDFNILKIDEFLNDLSTLLTYDYHFKNYDKNNFKKLYLKVKKELKNILLNKEDKVEAFLSKISEIRRTLNTSIDAILEGDPASVSKQQIVLEYPGFEAILNYRIAHEFYLLDFKMIARYISEKAHHHTGIDINPGATIGDYFFIDHGTGIVIGETCIIGNHVKLYQGVTLGALSLSKGRDLVGKKRHPTVKDYVTIYSNAAIFGGDTVIEEGCIIGGNVYLTHSIEKNHIVLQTDDDLTIVKKK